ncbi:MAG: DNA polymerase III subunit beta [Clostridiales bacterium]|nr:DNA polymerase III subunit beta [Clostridiales bacterium]
MKIICQQSVLNKALATVYKAITNRTTIPILKGILIETTSNNSIKLTATDSEISIEKECECIVEEPGSIVLYSKLFTEMIRKLPNSDVIIEEQNGNVNIKCKTYSSDIVSLQAEEFPNISEVEELEKIVLDKEAFKRMVRKTAFAASTDESRGILTGVLIEIKDNLISMVALDGFRMSMVKEETVSDKDIKVVISARLLNEVTKILSDEDQEEDFVLIIDKKKAVFIIGTTKITLRLLEGNFINYNEIIPKVHKCIVKADRRELVDVIERASLIVKEGKNNLIKIKIEENAAVISSRSEEGKIKEEISVDVEGEGLEIGFNSKYILDVMKVIDDDEVVLEFNTNVTPCLVKPVEGSSFEFLILPVRITS